MNDSSIARVVGVLFSPVRTFERIRERPTWLVALVVLVVIGVVTSYLVTGKLDMEEVVRDATAQSSRQISEDQLEQAIEFQEKFGAVFAMLGPLFFFPVGCLLIALLVWVTLKLLGSDFSYKTSFAATVHGLVPTGVGGLLALPVILSRAEFSYDDVKTGSILASNLGALAPEESSLALQTLLGSIDVFSIWCVVLLSIGYSVVARTSRAKSASVVIALWAVWIALKVGWAALSS